MVSHQTFETEHGVNSLSFAVGPPPSDDHENDSHVLLIANSEEALEKGNKILN
jgi:hypothetical protein